MLKFNAAFFLCLLCLCANANATQTIPADKSAGVILAYHRIDEDQYPLSTLQLSQFKEHLRILERENYNIIPLSVFIKKIKNGTALPDKTIAITFEGGFKSAYKHAMPLLIERKIPFTIFSASDHVSQDTDQYMNWADLRAMTRYNFVGFGLLPANYERLYDLPEVDILSQINRAKVAFRKNLKREPYYFSYPFGEYSIAYKSLIKEQGFDAALGLQSGSASDASDLYALPRFSMTEDYGDAERFEMVTNALPLPISQMQPHDPYLTTAQPSFGFTIDSHLSGDLKNLSCNISGQGRPVIETIGDTRVEIRPIAPITAPRTRLNCTIPVQLDDDNHQRWRWFSMLFVR